MPASCGCVPARLKTPPLLIHRQSSPLPSLAVHNESRFDMHSLCGGTGKLAADDQRAFFLRASLNHLIIQRRDYADFWAGLSLHEIHQLLALEKARPHVVSLTAWDDQLHRGPQ